MIVSSIIGVPTTTTNNSSSKHNFLQAKPFGI